MPPNKAKDWFCYSERIYPLIFAKVCNLCDDAFVRSSGLVFVLQRYRGGPKTKQFVCGNCVQSVDRPAKLIRKLPEIEYDEAVYYITRP